MSKLYLFDVDDTLEVNRGPVTFQRLTELRNAGHILGICGNWGLVTGMILGWDRIFSLVNVGIPKVDFLKQVKAYVPAEEHVFVGNDGSGGKSDDKGAAAEAGWRFILEEDFAAGVR